MGRQRKRKLRVQNSAPEAVMFGGSGIAATWDDTGGGYLYWPTLDERKEASSLDRETMIRKARALEANSGLAGAAVDNVVAYMGWLVPKADSDDKEWNKAADLAFLRRASNPEMFDVAGEMNWFMAQMWIERQRAIDGDCLTVLSWSPADQGAAFSFYSSPQIRNGGSEKEGWNHGCRVGKSGFVYEYGIYDYETGRVVSVPRRDAILYRHNHGGRILRGYSDLRRAIVNLHDIAEIVGYTKKGVKLGSSVGLVQTSDKEVKKKGLGAVAGKVEVVKTDDGHKKIERVMAGTSVVRLDPGKDLKILSDNRPSPNVMNLIQYLMDDISYGIGLTPGLLWDPERVGSAGTRFLLGRLKRWLKIRLMYRAQWCQKVWRYLIAKEMKEGRLRMCKDKNWMDVEWIPLPDMTIDVGREGNLMISLVDSGLADQDQWWLSNYGMTYEEGMQRKVENYKRFEEMCKEAGVDPNKVVPGANRGGISPSAPDSEESLKKSTNKNEYEE